MVSLVLSKLQLLLLLSLSFVIIIVIMCGEWLDAILSNVGVGLVSCCVAGLGLLGGKRSVGVTMMWGCILVGLCHWVFTSSGYGCSLHVVSVELIYCCPLPLVALCSDCIFVSFGQMLECGE